MKPAGLIPVITAFTMVGFASTAPDGTADHREPERLLETLRPGDPRGYLFAGEDLIEREDTARAGREALALAALLAADSDPALAASAVIALAAGAASISERTGLWSLAIELDPARAGDFLWTRGLSADLTEIARDAGQTLAALRVNNRDAAATLAQDSVLRERIIDEGVRLGHDAARVRAVLAKWENDASNDPCRGQLTMRVRAGNGLVQQSCPEPSYHHGLQTDSPDWAMMVGIEMSLLGAAPDSWHAQAAVGLDAALPGWTLDRVGATWGVSRSRPVRRAGRWTSP